MAALLTSSLLACGEELEKQSEVRSLRLLAIIAEQPEAAPSQIMNVMALWHDPAGRANSGAFFTWTSCPLRDPTELTSCESEPTPISGGRALDVVAVRLPNLIGWVRIGLEICAEPLVTGDCGRMPITAYKRIEVTDRQDRRQNPVIDEVQVDGRIVSEQSVAVPARRQVDIEVIADQPEEDELIVSWFATAGDFAAERSLDPELRRFTVEWQSPSEPANEMLWVVLRDGHGGVSYREIAVDVSAPLD